MDVVVFHPGNRHLIHIEPSSDADSWETRERRYAKKFEAGKKHIPALFKGLMLPDQIDQVAVLVFGSKANHERLAGGKLILAEELIAEILTSLMHKSIYSNAVSEQYPILRTLQFVCEYSDTVPRVLKMSRAKVGTRGGSWKPAERNDSDAEDAEQDLDETAGFTVDEMFNAEDDPEYAEHNEDLLGGDEAGDARDP